MTTRITQISEEDDHGAILRVEGALTIEEARVLEKVCQDLRERDGCGVRINLAGLSFLDDESASPLCRLKGLPGWSWKGRTFPSWKLSHRPRGTAAPERRAE